MATFLHVLSVGVIYFLSEISAEDALKKVEKRNDDSSVSEARARYLQRKLQRQQNKVV